MLHFFKIFVMENLEDYDAEGTWSNILRCH
jgi:hypothetical protein